MAGDEVTGESEPLERLGGGRTAEVFAWAPGVVVKLTREGHSDAFLDREAATLQTAAAAGIAVPTPLGFVTHEGRRGLLMERIDGNDIFSVIEKRPWRVWALTSLVGRLHVQLGGAEAPEALASVRERTREIIQESEHVPDLARLRLLAILDAAADGKQLCHLDFHPGNVMLAGERPYIIDFPNALRGPAIADHAKSWVILKAGAPTEGMGRFVRVLITIFRKLALTAYMRAYRTASPIDPVELARWQAIQVAVRLAEGIPAERPRLLRQLSRSLRKAEQYAL